MADLTVKEVVKDNIAKFSYYRQGFCYYAVKVKNKEYTFPVSLEDIGQASLFAEMKAITLMRYIRKAMEDGSFVPTGKVLIEAGGKPTGSSEPGMTLDWATIECSKEDRTELDDNGKVVVYDGSFIVGAQG